MERCSRPRWYPRSRNEDKSLGYVGERNSTIPFDLPVYLGIPWCTLVLRMVPSELAISQVDAFASIGDPARSSFHHLPSFSWLYYTRKSERERVRGWCVARLSFVSRTPPPSSLWCMRGVATGGNRGAYVPKPSDRSSSALLYLPRHFPYEYMNRKLSHSRTRC